MVIELCRCDRYPEPHDHARAMYQDVEGNWRTLKYPDGSEAKVGDVVRCIDMEAEGAALAGALRTHVTGEWVSTSWQALIDALARWDDAVATNNRAVRLAPPEAGENG